MTEFETIINPPQEVFEQIVKLTSETEDWSFHLDDYKYYLSSYDQFWLVAVLEKETRNLTATVSLARWDGEDGPLFSVGMYYVVPKYRGTGLGKPIFQKVMDIVGDNNCTLTGEVKMSEKYAKEFGFDKCSPHWLLYSTLKMTDCVIPDKVSEKYTTKVYSDVNYDALTAYDRTICTRDRKKLMTPWFNMKNTFARTSGKVRQMQGVRLHMCAPPKPVYQEVDSNSGSQSVCNC